MGLGVEPGSGNRRLSELFAEAASDRRGEEAPPLHDVVVDTRIARLSILPGDPLLESAVARPGILPRIVRPYVDQIAFCVIDCPPNLGFLTANALHTQAEFPRGLILTPLQQARWSLEGLAQFLDALEELSEINPRINPENFRVVLTMVDARVKRTRTYVERELNAVAEKICRTVIRRCEELNHSQACSQTIFEFNPLSSAALDYWALTGEILTILEKKEETTDGTHSSNRKQPLETTPRQ